MHTQPENDEPLSIPITRQQRVALHRAWVRNNCGMTYRQFRKTAFPTLANDDCIIVRWGSMWLGIEPDGYAHT